MKKSERTLKIQKLQDKDIFLKPEIYLKQIEKDNFVLEDLLKEISNDETEENLINEISKIESSISRSGPINLAAAEEYKVEEERKLEIESQFSELEKALTTLQML